MRLLDIEREGLNTFCNFMDICSGLTESAYNKIIEHIYSVTKVEFESCAQRAINEEKKENKKRERSIFNFKVSGNGSWKKHLGLKSLFDVHSVLQRQSY